MKGTVFLDVQESIIPYIAIDPRKEVHPRYSGTAGYSDMQIRMCLSLIRIHKNFFSLTIFFVFPLAYFNK